MLFERPYFLLLLVIPIFYLINYFFSKRQFYPNLKVSHNSLSDYKNRIINPEIFGRVLKAIAIILLLISVSGPYVKHEYRKTIDGQGISIILAIDISASMLAKDFKPDRLSATKKVATEFVLNRTDDLIGIVLYAGESFTKIPLTSDKNALVNAINEITYGFVDDGTAIGMGLATAVNRIKNSPTKSKVIILMSDGENNMGEIDPLTAAEMAATFGIRVYTIGVGTKGYALTPVAYDYSGNLIFENRQVTIDENLLKKIASITGASYYRATDGVALKKIYDEINKLERSKITEIKYDTKREYFTYFLYSGMALFLLDWLLKIILFRNLIE
ncbi:BatA protein [Thermaurantimonas aggregans]|uniref:BatA protein n=1 Tax=Thermaurantimonas aggregans TaxID=2173829 RepID=A0A401XL63_9FLAO|nr:VWA domain-containing protein [Thermaurantimonas aggregans]MCX8148165.1 VWA domain-containing protein [Thermaurantimonas aggregans]GCD77767.1 BatA protein [Thermaurantimonas aggregans]